MGEQQSQKQGLKSQRKRKIERVMPMRNCPLVARSPERSAEVAEVRPLIMICR
jgi:hypothetical protein